MTDIDALQKLMCRGVRVERRPDGALMLHAPFRYPDGDECPIHLAEAAPAGWRLSDRGHTLMRLSYEHDVDELMDGARGALVERIVAESGLHWQEGALCLDAAAEDLPGAAFRFGRTLARVYDLAASPPTSKPPVPTKPHACLRRPLTPSPQRSIVVPRWPAARRRAGAAAP